MKKFFNGEKFNGEIFFQSQEQRERKKQRGRWRDRDLLSAGSLPKVAAMVRAGLGQSQESGVRSQEFHLGLCHGWKGPKLLGHLLLLFPRLLAGSNAKIV